MSYVPVTCGILALFGDVLKVFSLSMLNGVPLCKIKNKWNLLESGRPVI
jgi:hypothetical protein